MSETPVQTVVCICEHRRMSETAPPSISIRLSPTQVDEVVRAATQNRTPSLSTLIAGVLNAPMDRAGSGTGELGPGGPSASAAPASLGTVDPRLSQSLLRGLSLLTSFGPARSERGIVELAADLGMSPSTAHRYAVTLVELGLLERCPTTRKYRLPEIETR
jgi:IclR helix-turn-helix domain